MATTPPVYHAFTSKYDGISNCLRNHVFVEYGGEEMLALALWDTGASVTCISKCVVEKLGLIPTGKQRMYTPSGGGTANTYLLNIKLPNNILIPAIKVCDSEIDKQGLDVLIGMDIISKGDFAVSNYNGKTVFSFRTPSKQLTDYVEQINVAKIIGSRHGVGKRKRKHK